MFFCINSGHKTKLRLLQNITHSIAKVSVIDPFAIHSLSRRSKNPKKNVDWFYFFISKHAPQFDLEIERRDTPSSVATLNLDGRKSTEKMAHNWRAPSLLPAKSDAVAVDCNYFNYLIHTLDSPEGEGGGRRWPVLRFYSPNRRLRARSSSRNGRFWPARS